jgi:TonB family protein
MNPRHTPDDSLSHPERLARWLIQRSARNAPPSLAPRLEEEWLADLAAQPTGLPRLRFAIGCCWATQIIAHDLTLNARATSSATGHAAVATLAQHDASLFSRRTTVFFLIVCVHGLVIYGFANGLVHKVIAAIQPPTMIRFVSEPAPHEKPAPLPEPPLWTPLRVPVPEPPLDFPIDATPADDPVTKPPPDSSPPQSPPIVVHRVIGGPGPGFPDTDPYYPVVSRRLEESGIATLRVCVDGSGRLASDPAITQSSGSSRLDEGALKLAKAGSGHYRSTTENGTPVSYCYPLRIRFELSK